MSMKKIEHVEEIKLFFKVWCPRNDEVLFILFKDGSHNYYDLRHHNIEAHTVCLYIEDVVGRYEKIAFAAIEDWAVGVRNPGESALSAIPEWFEDRIDEYTEKLKEEQKMEEKWYLYYTTHECKCDSTIIIAKTYNDAKNRAEAAGMDGNIVWICEADEWDIKLKASGEYHNGASVLTLSRDAAGYSVFAIDKYADEIAAIKSAKRNAATVQKDDVIDKEKFLSMFNVGSYYKISYTDDLIEGDKNTFCIIRFKEYLFDKEAIFENIYDHHMGLVPLITVDMLNIRNDDYTIVKIPYGGEIRE